MNGIKMSDGQEPWLVTSLQAHQAAQQFAHLAAQLQTILNMIPAFAWYASPSGALTFVNKRTADYLGLPNDAPLRFGIATGAAWDSHIPLLHPDDHDETRRVWSTCLSTGAAGEVSFRVRDAQGGYRWFLSCAEPLRSSGGSLLGWVGVNLDIEELKRAEFYLAEGQRLTHTSSWVWNVVDRSAAHLSEEWYRIFGFDPAEGHPSWERQLERVHPEDRIKWKDTIERAILDKADYDVDFRIIVPGGKIKWIHTVGHPVLTPGGDLVQFLGCSTDITERKQAEQKLKDQEMELRQMLDLTPQYLGVLGADGSPIYANRASLDYLGISLEEWKQRGGIGDEVHPDDAERARTELERALSTGSAVEIEERVRRGDGSFRWILSRCSPVRDENGQLTRLYLASVDIHDRKIAEERLKQENAALREEIDKTSMFEEIVGTSPALKTVLSRISKVAPSDSTVLITGETGTGKELVARAIHRRSNRASRPFVSVNCAAIPRDLIVSELFGHEKGAFTGAMQRRVGRFELAEGGTIFLDEVGELLPDTQAALLRVLQEREFERVGGGQSIRVDVRVVAATNRDLKAAVSNGAFREDLYYRLNVFPLEVPPLRARRADIPLLVEYFIDRYRRKAGKNISSVDKKTLQLLQSYPWPGNIRELQNIIERSVIVCETEIFTVDERWLSQRPLDSRAGTTPFLSDKVAATERESIEEALRESQGRVFGPNGAAARLGIARSTLESKIRSLHIDKNRFKAPRGS